MVLMQNHNAGFINQNISGQDTVCKERLRSLLPRRKSHLHRWRIEGLLAWVYCFGLMIRNPHNAM